jgi:uncharacterized integral membrane protein
MSVGPHNDDASQMPDSGDGQGEAAAATDLDRGTVAAQPADTQLQKQQRPRSRVSATWTAVLAGAVVIVLLLFFILQNSNRVKVSFFGGSWQIPLGVALLFAAVGGALLVGIIGVARLAQVRLSARRWRRAALPK